MFLVTRSVDIRSKRKSGFSRDYSKTNGFACFLWMRAVRISFQIYTETRRFFSERRVASSDVWDRRSDVFWGRFSLILASFSVFFCRFFNLFFERCFWMNFWTILAPFWSQNASKNQQKINQKRHQNKYRKIKLQK